MATFTNLASGTDTGAGDTVVTGATVTVASGDWLVVFVACPNNAAGGAAPTVTVADSGSLNTYTLRATINRDPGGVGDGTTLKLFTSQITNSVTSGTITATISDSPNSRAIQVYRMRPASGEVIAFVSADSTGDTGSSANVANGSISVTSGDTIFAGASVETNGTATGDSDTTNGSWSAILNQTADNGTDTSSSAVISQYKTVTATGSQAWTATYGGAHDFAASNIILRAAKTLTAAVGSYAITGTAASLEKSRFITAAAGSYAITGTDPTISYTGAKKVNAEPGIYAFTGTDASTLQAWKPTAGAGSYAITGTDPSTLHGWAVIPDAGSYVITGTDTPVLQARKVVPDAGSYAISGTDQALVKSGTYVIVADLGSYAFTGTAASLAHGYVVRAGTSTGATNVCLQSQTFDNATWTKSNSSITADATTAPDGTTTADKLIDSASNTKHYCAQAITVSSGLAVTISVYAKAAELSAIDLYVHDTGESKGVFCDFNVLAGTVGTPGSFGGPAVPTGTITSAGSGWYRCTMTVTLSSTTVYNYWIELTNGVSTTYIGTGTGLYLWGAQMEAGSSATDYIVTTSSAAVQTPTAGSYVLTGTDATVTHAYKTFLDVPGSYLITGTGVALTKTQAAAAPLIGTLRAASFSHSLVINPRPPSSVPVVSHIHSLQVDTRPPTVGVSAHIFTIKVR